MLCIAYRSQRKGTNCVHTVVFFSLWSRVLCEWLEPSRGESGVVYYGIKFPVEKDVRHSVLFLAETNT
jgi:hypothetical protein